MAEMNDDQWEGTGRPLGQAADDSGQDQQDETVVIRAEIVETRERMSDTLDEIGERLNPHLIREQVTERVKDNIRDATIGRVGHMARDASDSVNEAKSTMMDTIRDNPIPAAMVAVGLGWLVWNGRKEGSSSDRSSSRYGYGASGNLGRANYADSAGYPYGSGNLYTGAGAYAGERYGSDQYADSQYGGGQYGGGQYGQEDESTMDRARERASELGESAKERASDVADRAQDMAHSVAGRAQDMAGMVANRTRRGAGRVEDSFYDNPLALGAVTMALGVAAGLAIPETDREAELMGGARDKLVDRVKDAAEDAKDKVQHVASRAMEETKSAAREEGLTG